MVLTLDYDLGSPLDLIQHGANVACELSFRDAQGHTVADYSESGGNGCMHGRGMTSLRLSVLRTLADAVL